MATLPRTSKLSNASPIHPPSVVASSLFDNPVPVPARPHSEFDSGINTSAAWTEHRQLHTGTGSLSDDEPDTDDEQQHGRPARALYVFEGKTEFRELSVDAGDEIEVLKEELADGWSLVKSADGEMGLLPRSYYTFTSDFIAAPEHASTQQHGRDASTSTITPAAPIVPQTTGEWRNAFPSFRHNLLGGKSLNRFSSFVTSGAEEWVLKGSAPTGDDGPHAGHAKEESAYTYDEDNRLSRLGMGEADRHFVDAGPAWKTKLPPFRVLVHSPSKRTSTLSGAYTVYSVTSLFHASSSIPEEGADPESEADYTPPNSPARITVHRRFSHFVVLHTALTRRLPGIALPPLPEKQYAGRFSTDFVEARRGDLERYIGRIVRHPVARYAEVVTFFLGCESDKEWSRQLPLHLSLPPAGPSFYAHVFHPAFNVDAEDATDAVARFETHTHAIGRGVQGLREIFGRVREARVEMSKAERLLSYSLLSLITSKPLASAPLTGIDEDDEDNGSTGKPTVGLLNEDGAWCWREGCEDCLVLTKALQKTSEGLQNVADLYDDHARRTQLATHEALKNVAHPSSMYESVIDTHKSTLSRYTEATRDGRADEEMAARCETVLNTTMAEMETYHTQKSEDFRAIATEHLDGEISFYEQVLTRLRAARNAFDTVPSPSPRQPSIYERELADPRLGAEPLPQPCPHVFDSAPMRPVSAAIQEGVGMLLGSAGREGRGSVFGKFW
ncbi:hypothetical protein PLICRDRAFT_46118 [Plicaturopsis crispa FD-325 SS-3]|uniref:PX-domain-containing protein n=1 Tax=Plicaturopsis crispa FD-325 SS-3 TaxID=944288 RepID=A0A0C9T4P7_PLICR|nr:hypothetical protein PLICRDRAFT_46118 [Plicaturopsis crispa FD-325 SS-3]